MRTPGQAAGFVVLAADGAGETDLFEAESSGLLDQPVAWLFGNEAWGLPDELAALADHRVGDPDPRPRREPQPLHRRGGLPLRQRRATAVPTGSVEELGEPVLLLLRSLEPWSSRLSACDSW